MKRAALLLVLGLVAFLGSTMPAHAHADLLSSTPEDGAVLAEAPAEVVLSFSEELLPDTVVVSVSDETGFVVRVLSLEVSGSDVIVTWPPGMSGTAYQVNYRVVSQDGHPIEGTVGFTVEDAESSAAPAGSASPQPAASAAGASEATGAPADTGVGLAPLAAVSAGLAVGIAIGFLFWITRRRSGRRSSDGAA